MRVEPYVPLLLAALFAARNEPQRCPKLLSPPRRQTEVTSPRRCPAGQRRANAPCGVTRIAAEALPPNIVGHLTHPSGRKR